LSIAGRSERTRRLVHFTFGFGVLLVPVLGRAGCVIVAGAALLYNAWVAPRFRLDRRYRRPGEGLHSGLVTYPLAVLLLVACCPLDVAAGAWAVLAWGDPAAATVGSLRPRPTVPWNSAKSLAGTLAGVLAGAIGAGAALLYVGGGEVGGALLARAGAAALAAMLVESLVLPIDDNLPVAAAAVTVLLAWS